MGRAFEVVIVPVLNLPIPVNVLKDYKDPA